jgi:hypothetical protein
VDQVADRHHRGAHRRKDGAGRLLQLEQFRLPCHLHRYEVTDYTRLLWGGTAGGITGIYEWIFEGTPEGVHVVTNESFSGAPVDADRRNMQQLFDASLVTWLDHPKRTAEAVPDGGLGET